MSGWDAWNAHVMAVPGIQGGGIYTLEGAACAQSGLNVTTPEVQAIVSGLSGTNSLSSVTLGGVKYMLLRSDADGLQARQGPTPVSIYKTATLLIIGVGQQGASAEVLSVGIAKVQEMLAGQNL